MKMVWREEKEKGGDPMTKKQKKAKNAESRVLVPFNTGTRDMKSPKDFNRQELKKALRKEISEG